MSSALGSVVAPEVHKSKKLELMKKKLQVLEVHHGCYDLLKSDEEGSMVHRNLTHLEVEVWRE